VTLTLTFYRLENHQSTICCYGDLTNNDIHQIFWHSDEKNVRSETRTWVWHFDTC